MSILELRRKISHGLLASVIAGSVFIAACGGSSGGSTQTAGIGGTGVAAGKATGFGSIYVNGRKFNTDESQFIVDGDDTLGQDDLAVGMYVKLRVKTKDGNLTGKALEVVYDDEVQGPVAGLPALVGGETQRVFTVFGQNVTIDDIGTLFQGTPGNPGFGFDTISNSDVVEISGFRASANDITATYVEFKEVLNPDPPFSEVELRGTVTGYDPTPPESFGLANAPGITITTDGLTVKDLESGPLGDGLYVEVEGLYLNATTVLAREIEEEDEEFGDDIDDVSLHGVISNYVGIGDFEIDGLPIDASGASLSPANAASLLGNGVEVEVEGDIVGGVLIADELELREGESKLRSFVSSVDLMNTSFEMNFDSLPDTVTVKTNGQTTFEDEAGPNPLENMSFGDLVATDFVRVEGIADGGEVIAEIVKRRDADDTELEGAVEDFDALTYTWIRVLGITYNVDPGAGGTEFEGFPDAATFFGQLDIGDIVEIKDDMPADGIADEIEEE